MSNKSDLILTCMMLAFFAFFMFRLPDAPQGLQNQVTQNATTFSNTLASDYNAAQPADLTQIAPAAGTPAPEDKQQAADKIEVPPAPAQ